MNARSPNSATRKLRIFSDGSPLGTSLIDAETGQPIAGVTSILVTVGPDREPRAVVTLTGVAVNVEAEARILPAAAAACAGAKTAH